MTTIEPLPYAYNALEPYIDAETMKIHHDKHHQAYFDKFTAAIANNPELKNKNVEEILKNLKMIPTEIKSVVINNGGGHYHHHFFWRILKKEVPFKGEIAHTITQKWGSYEKFKEELSNLALSQFGSGWAWLVLNKEKGLELLKTSNQDSPLSLEKIPLLGIDVWEHAYYLKYQNKRADYVENFFKVINWENVNLFYLQELKKRG